jgi:REP element-mobilizing transposase RayT
MRQARLKPDYRDTWHHCYNRVVGTCEDRPFGDAEKEQFVRILRRVADFYAVRIVAYQVMSNHFHLVLQAPEEPPSAEETARRFAAFHGGRRTLAPDSPLCEQWRARLRDVSWCLRHLQHLHTA